ncbi:FKBP-type peptidyl-prolyl cis-trans isomerase [Candidatus Saccharibacteria bacterium]|nr:FKBP-type peptidyl-prolyl cis-trans isomerase [Candidatus Saccharibacteria bacterium]
MNEKDLKPSWRQRLVFALVAVALVGSSIVAYVLIVMGNGTIDYSKMTLSQLETAYSEKTAELEAEATSLSEKYFEDFKSYKKNVKAYNSTTANSGGVLSTDLKEGDGEEVTTSNYAAYYIGWCHDEEIFDSSFDNFDEPTALKAPIIVSPNSLIEGWYAGVSGMKLGGVREITVPGSLAYGDTYEICGAKNSPLKFIIMAVEKSENLEKINSALNDIYTALSSAYAASYSNYNDSSAYEYDDTGETSGE